VTVREQITIEGYSPAEILLLPDEQLDAFVFCDAPVTLHIGSATILGAFSKTKTALVVELAHIDGGGEGVLLVLWTLVRRYAVMKGLKQTEWIVHALDCAHPNLKLQRVLQRKGFVIEDVPGKGRAYHRVIAIPCTY